MFNDGDILYAYQLNQLASIGYVDGKELIIRQLLNGFTTPQQYGGVGDGVNDDTQAILSAVAAAESQGMGVYMPPGNYIFQGANQLNIDISRISFSGIHGAVKVDMSGCTQSPHLRIYGSLSYPQSMYKNTINKVYGIEFCGGLISGRDLLQIGHLTEDYNGQSSIEHCSFYRADNVITCQANTWRYNFNRCTISTGITSLFNAPSGLANSGESNTFTNCQISDSAGAPFIVACDNFSIGMTGTSVLNTELRITGNASSITIDGMGNIENPGKSTWVRYATVTGNASRLIIDTSTINIGAPSAQTRPIFFCDTNSLIQFDNVIFPSNDYPFESLNPDKIRSYVEGAGSVRVSNCSYALSAGAGNIPVHSSINRLLNSGFELGNTNGWAINNQGISGQTAVAATNAANSGAYGMRMTSVSAQSVFASQFVTVKPCEQFATTLSLKIEQAAADSGVSGNISIAFFSYGGPTTAGTQISSFSSNFGSAIQSYASSGRFLRGKVPSGCAYAQISIQCRNGAIICIDDVIINFI